jgi:hypothetical protein
VKDILNEFEVSDGVLYIPPVSSYKEKRKLKPSVKLSWPRAILAVVTLAVNLTIWEYCL